MSFFWQVVPSFRSESGAAYAGGLAYFGQPNVDPKNNPKPIYLDAARTIEAANPQPLNDFGSPAQGTIYLEDSGSLYSVLIEDDQGNQKENVPAISGIDIPRDLSNLPPVTVRDNVEVVSDTDAVIKINSGVSTGSEGTLEYQEGGVSQWEWLRQAIVDGGAMILRRLAGTGAPDEPMQFPYTGGSTFRWLGTDRIRVESDGVALLGKIKNNKQVLIAAGTFLHDGTPVGKTLGITSAGTTGTGEYTVILDTIPDAEVDLQVGTSAELVGAEMVTRGVGGANGSGTVLVYTTINGGARADATSFTVRVFDMGL